MSIDVLDPFKAHYDSPVRAKIAELLKILPKWHGLCACSRRLHYDVSATEDGPPGTFSRQNHISAALDRLSAAISIGNGLINQSFAPQQNKIYLYFF